MLLDMVSAERSLREGLSVLEDYTDLDYRPHSAGWSWLTDRDVRNL